MSKEKEVNPNKDAITRIVILIVATCIWGMATSNFGKSLGIDFSQLHSAESFTKPIQILLIPMIFVQILLIFTTLYSMLCYVQDPKEEEVEIMFFVFILGIAMVIGAIIVGVIGIIISADYKPSQFMYFRICIIYGMGLGAMIGFCVAVFIIHSED